MRVVRIALSLLILWAIPAYAVDALVTWDAPTTNADGTPLTDLDGYRLSWGLAPGIYDVGSIRLGKDDVSYVIQGLQNATQYHVQIVAIDTAGNESVPATGTWLSPANPDPLLPIPPPSDSMVRLPFDASDAMANYGSGASATMRGGQPTQETRSGHGLSLVMDGLDDWVDLGQLALPTEGFTFTTWFRVADLFTPQNDTRIASKACCGAGSQDHVFMVSLWSTDNVTSVIRVRIRVAGATHTLITSGALMAGMWHHVAVTHDNQVTRAYVDGQMAGELVLAGPIDDIPSYVFALGAQPPGAGTPRRYLNGRLDDVRLYPAALSEARINEKN